jgi:hypothetical protein
MHTRPHPLRTQGKRRLLPYLPAGLFALVGAAAIAAPQAAPDMGEMAVIFPPFTSETDAWERVHQAGGYVVGPTNFSNIVVVYADDAQFKDRAGQYGALWFTAATGLCAEATS